MTIVFGTGQGLGGMENRRKKRRIWKKWVRSWDLVRKSGRKVRALRRLSQPPKKRGQLRKGL